LVALNSDVEDVQEGTTREGMHMGVMAGTLDLMQRAYLGTEIRDEVHHVEPGLPGPIQELSFTMQARLRWITRSSRPGIRPGNSSCAHARRSPPRPRPGSRLDPGIHHPQALCAGHDVAGGVRTGAAGRGGGLRCPASPPPRIGRCPALSRSFLLGSA
jgi:hypothetical protein